MEKMSTILAFLLMALNTGSLTGILALAFSISDVKYSLFSVKIIAIISYLFILSFLSSFCLTENECCECCCPANKCCLIEKKPNKPHQQPVSTEGAGTGTGTGANNKGQNNQDCCVQFCDCLYDCLFIPISSCIRKIGKQGSRYFSVIILAGVHAAMIALCIHAVSKTDEKMNTKTVIIVIICGVIVVANIFAMVAPCFKCCEKLRYKEKKKKEENKDIKENKIKDEYKNDPDIVNVKNALDAALIENKQNNEYNYNNNENNEYKNNQDFQEKIETANNTINTVNKANNVANDFGKVFGINKTDVNNEKKE